MAPKLWANWTRPYFNKKGQAILELAVFGSILIMLLGILVNYGLKYNFQQQVMQQAFRKALGIAANRPSATYILVKDRHIPDPSNPFGVGSVMAVSSSASIVRDYKMQETADTAGELPRIDIETPDGGVSSYKTAAFRDEYNVPEADLEDDYDSDGDGTIDDDEKDVSRYDYIYGSEDIAWWETGDGECGCEMEIEINPNTGGETETCPCPTKNIRLIDTCAGEVLNYEVVQTRCYKIEEAGINRPWYCDQLDTLFAFSDISDPGGLKDKNKPTMGLQAGYIQDTTIDNTLNKQESASTIKSKDTLNWQASTQRKIVYNDAVDASGVSKEIVNVRNEEVTTSVSQEDKTYEWETAF